MGTENNNYNIHKPIVYDNDGEKTTLSINIKISSDKDLDELIRRLKRYDFQEYLAKDYSELDIKRGGAVDSMFAYEFDINSIEAFAKLTFLMEQANYNSECAVAIGVDIEGKLNIFLKGTDTYNTSFIKLKNTKVAEHFLLYHKLLLMEYFQI